MEKVLIVSVNWLGDAIMMTPIPRALKEKNPSLEVSVLAPQRVAGVFRNNPYVDEVIPFDDDALKKSFIEKLALVRTLRQKKFDMAFLVHRSFSRALICWGAGIKHRIGYARPKNFFILTKKIPEPTKALHRQDYYLHLFEKVGIKIHHRQPQIYISKKAEDKINHFLQPIRRKHSIFIGINPSANWTLKRWPAANFAYLADKLIAELNCAVFFIGTYKDKNITNQVLEKMHHTSYDMCGKTTLDELAALITNFNLFISNDSGPAHLAAALDIKTIALFGPTSSKITAPRGNHVKIICGSTTQKAECKVPCYNLKCKNNVCMQSIDRNDVLDAAKRLL
ncbi:MAG: lipopolysaccharide heptosyltransferase II [Candidatus Omnitrophica bacterium]|nr:lipopolysaccharide heptosyltransferase II [Candidatus Omnitrophota bacterium]